MPSAHQVIHHAVFLRDTLPVTGTLEDEIVGSASYYSMELFMIKIAAKAGKSYGWKANYIWASTNTQGVRPVSEHQLAKWARSGLVPAWAVDQIDRMDFRRPFDKKSTAPWTKEEDKYFVSLWTQKPRPKMTDVAVQCTQHFGRDITLNAVRGKIHRLRSCSLIPQKRS